MLNRKINEKETYNTIICVLVPISGLCAGDKYNCLTKNYTIMRRTFLNGDAELAKRGLKHLKSIQEDLLFFEEYGALEGVADLIEELRYKDATFKEAREAIRQFEEVGNLSDYGLSFGYVELGTFNDQNEDYFRYQFSWGGPSDELRIYEDGTIEYVFLDWFVGVGFDVTDEPGFKWLADDLDGFLNFEKERESYDYYSLLYELKDKDE